VAAYGKLDAAVLAIGLALLVLSVWPAAPTSLCTSRGCCLWLCGSDYKARSAFVVRHNPSVSIVLLMDAIMSLPTTIAKITEPQIPPPSFRVEGVDPRCTGRFLNLRDSGRSRLICRVHGRRRSPPLIQLHLDFRFLSRSVPPSDSALDVRLTPHRGR